MAPQIILASQSPRRQALIERIGLGHEVLPVEVDETAGPGPGRLGSSGAYARTRTGSAKGKG